MVNYIRNLFPESIEDLAFSLVMLGIGITAGILFGFIAFRTIHFGIKKKNSLLAEGFKKHLKLPLIFLSVWIFYHFVFPLTDFPQPFKLYFAKGGFIIFIVSICWSLIRTSELIKDQLYGTYDIDIKDNLKHRKLRTQIQFIHQLVAVIISIVGASIILMSFDKVRELGASILASAGVAGIIIGFAAQRSIANLLAGLQIAFTQPIRIDDVVIVEGEWGKVEEINMTYVVVSIWDQRRLILPISYFIEKPFQNWTRVSADLLGTVMIHADYSLPVDAVRKELTRILENEGKELWDKRVNVVQVTDSTDKTIVIRALISAGDASKAWDLRCIVREKLIAFLQKEYPEALPKIRSDKGVLPTGAKAED